MSGGLTVFVDWDGKSWTVDGELVSFTDRLDIADPSSIEPRRLTVSVHLGNVCAFIGQGHHPSTCYVRVNAGDRIVARGIARGMTPGRAGEPTTITLEDAVALDSTPIPSVSVAEVTRIDVQKTVDYRAERNAQIEADRANAKKIESALWFTFLRRDVRLEVLEAAYATSEDTWTDYVTTSEGRIYPIVFGNPGRTRGGGKFPCGYALAVDAVVPRVLVAGHACSPGTVWIYGPKKNNKDELVWEEFDVEVMLDNAGTEVTTVDLSGAAFVEGDWVSHPDASQKDWYFSFAGTSSGLDGRGPAVFDWFLSRMQGTRVDPSGLGSVEHVLSRYTFDGVIDDVAPAWRLFSEGVLAFVPVYLVSGLDGIGFRYVELDPELAQPRFTLTDGNQVAVTSRFVFASGDGGDVVTALNLGFGPNRYSDAMAYNATYQADGWAWGQLSAQRFGRITERQEAALLGDPDVARLVARDWLRRRAVDRRRGELAVDASVYGLGASRELKVGDCVRIEAPDEGVSGPAIVTRITRDGSRTDVVEVTVLA